MTIIIDEYHKSVDVQNGCFRIEHSGESKDIPVMPAYTISPHRVTALHIRKTCNLSSAAILLAAEHDIPVLLFDSAGRIQARVWRPHFGSHALIRRRQVGFSRSLSGRAWVSGWLKQKAEAQEKILVWLSAALTGETTGIANGIGEMQKWYPVLAEAREPGAIRLAEAQIARAYWATLFGALRKTGGPERRSRQPAEDPFNALLNYGYGILYADVETAALTAGLDPHTGILHADEHNRPSLVFDAIEPFRPFVEKLVVKLHITGAIKSTWFKTEDKGAWLTKEGKKVFIPEYIAMMNRRSQYGGKKLRRYDQVQRRLTELAQHLLNQGEEDAV